MPKLEITGTGPFECDSRPLAGKEVGLEVTPRFYGTGMEVTNCVQVRVLDDDGELVKIYALRISGRTLNVTLADRTKPAIPGYLRKKQDMLEETKKRGGVTNE